MPIGAKMYEQAQKEEAPTSKSDEKSDKKDEKSGKDDAPIEGEVVDEK